MSTHIVSQGSHHGCGVVEAQGLGGLPVASILNAIAKRARSNACEACLLAERDVFAQSSNPTPERGLVSAYPQRPRLPTVCKAARRAMLTPCARPATAFYCMPHPARTWGRRGNAPRAVRVDVRCAHRQRAVAAPLFSHTEDRVPVCGSKFTCPWQRDHN